MGSIWAFSDAMIFAIQQAYYLNAKNPSDIDVLTECAVSIGLDADTFLQNIEGEIETIFRKKEAKCECEK